MQNSAVIPALGTALDRRVGLFLELDVGVTLAWVLALVEERSIWCHHSLRLGVSRKGEKKNSQENGRLTKRSEE